MYSHHLARFNYTSYDVRRAEDVINPGTTHRDVMMLANRDDPDSDSEHPFLYARVLGVYHGNVIYTGTGGRDYNARRVEFLWVRWFKYVEDRSIRWSDLRLDQVCFYPMAAEESFGFVDPEDVVRSCHIIPRFSAGKVHSDGIGLSCCVNDNQDWKYYYVNRQVLSNLFQLCF